MAKEGIFALVTAAFPTTPIVGAAYARIVPTTVAVRDKIVKDSVMTDWDLAVELYGNDHAALEALVGVTAANLVLTVLGRAGASETHTLVGVYFHEVIQGAEAKEVDGGGKLPPYGIRGMCENTTRAAFSALWT